jgi:hypothetical protein
MFALTPDGQRTIEQIMEREREFLLGRADELDGDELNSATRTLADLRHALRKESDR